MGFGSIRQNLTVFAGVLFLSSCGNVVGFREQSTDIGDLPRLGIHIGDDEMEILYESLTNDAYARCRFDNGSGSRSAGIRIRGNSSRMQPKKSFTLVFEEDGKEVKVALDFGGDPWFFYYIAMFAYGSVGLPAPQLRPVGLFLNDSYLGYYCMIRMYSEDLNGHYGDPDGQLFKFHNLADESAEKKFPDDGDNSLFQQLMANVEQLPSDRWVEWCEEHVDLESVAKYVAVSDYLGIWDIRTKNFYVYFGDRVRVLPWDNDHGLCYSGPGGDDAITERLFESPLFLESYRDHLKAYFLEEGPDNIVSLLEQRLDELAAQLDTAAQNSPVFYLTYQGFLDEKAAFETFLDTRSGQILSDSKWAEFVE
jgi:hypothetical protein